MEYFCVFCEKELKDKKKFCSNSCKCKYFYKLHPEKCNKWNRENPKPNIKNKCKTCGDECGRKKYCSKECKPSYSRLKEYWENIERYNTKCGVCNNTIFILHIHHKNGNHNDNKLENLIGLCPSCHQKLHAPKKRKLKYYKKHSSEIQDKLDSLRELLHKN